MARCSAANVARASLGAIALVASPALQGQAAKCEVPAFSGAASVEGATITMRVVNEGRPCGVTLFGVPAQKRNPASDGVILSAPRNGKAVFDGPRIEYTPAPGFTGDDEFIAQARAMGDSRAPLTLKVRVVVPVIDGPVRKR